MAVLYFVPESSGTKKAYISAGFLSRQQMRGRPKSQNLSLELELNVCVAL